MRPFRYERPTALADAVAILAGAGDRGRLLAGGTDLIIRLRDRTLTPDVVVDVKRVAELDRSVRVLGDRLVIGAGAVMTDIAGHDVVRSRFTALAEAALVVGSVQIRNRATLAGNVCNASPAADTAPALLAFGATVVVAGEDGERRIPIDDWFVRSGVTTLRRGELVTSIELPLPSGPIGSTHVRRTRRRGHDLASVTLACVARADGTASVAFGSVGPRPLVVADETGALLDADASAERRMAMLDRLVAAAAPSPTSMRARPDYRLAMLRVLAHRAAATAGARLKDAAA